ncbi:MAG: pyruvate, phosphate dikinase [Chthoniobacterales bacterium]|nr:pyruvate, phosphate dikinase [Chthoniobacterales bacterium]
MTAGSGDSPPPAATTGLPGLDAVLHGIRPGDNIVWGVDCIEDYARLVQPYEKAAREAGRRVVYFRFARHAPLFPGTYPIRVHEIDPTPGFEHFVREVHRIIEDCGPGTVYIFDSLSSLADAWFSDQALGNFFVLTCPRLFDLHTVTYFAIERDRHSIHAIEPIRRTTQFFLEVFTQDGGFYIRPIKVQYRSQDVMDTLHVEQQGGEFVPVEESAVLARILSKTRWPRLMRNRRSGYWDGMYQEMDRLIAGRATGISSPAEEAALLHKVRAAFRVHRSGIAALVEKWLGLEDFQSIRQRMIGIGSIGGKALGMLVSRSILREREPDVAARLEVHDSFFVGAEVFVTFLVRNGVWWIRERQKSGQGTAEELEDGRRRILTGVFPPDVLLQFEGMLDYFGERPCIVRSSSILEDARGNAFSGKYESVFLANRGSREERLEALLHAVREVYASVLDPDAILYRKARNLLASEERMALLIMRVSGRQRGSFFFPQAAGVGLSYNPWSWHPDIDPEAGVVRLVFGLGTRAVDRADDDYTRLVSLSAPLRRPETSLDEQRDHSQRRMDAIDLGARALVSRPVEDLVPLCGDFPVRHFVDFDSGQPWVTFNRLIKNTGVVADFRRMLSALEAEYDAPVDIEFTINFLDPENYAINLLQCRTFQVRKHVLPLTAAAKPPAGRAILLARGAVIGLGREIPVDDIIYVPTASYAALHEQDRYGVARLIENLTQAHDPARNLVLIGPGRWGTAMPALGIPVRSGRIALACAVCEIVAMHAGLVPDVSLGTHFFNDLVEHDLLYLACFPGKPGNMIDEKWFSAAVSKTPPGAKFAGCVRLIDMSSTGAVLTADTLNQTAAIRLPGEAG